MFAANLDTDGSWDNVKCIVMPPFCCLLFAPSIARAMKTNSRSTVILLCRSAYIFILSFPFAKVVLCGLLLLCGRCLYAYPKLRLKPRLLTLSVPGRFLTRITIDRRENFAATNLICSYQI